jgi:FMN-dependent NADH-azoreductase
MELILGFIGLTDIRSITVEPTLAAGPDVAAEKVKIAELAARKMAMEF